MNTETQNATTIDTLIETIKQKQITYIQAIGRNLLVGALLATIINFFKEDLENILPYMTFLLMAPPFILMGRTVIKHTTWENGDLIASQFVLFYLLTASKLNIPFFMPCVLAVSIVGVALYHLSRFNVFAVNRYLKLPDNTDEYKINILEKQFVLGYKKREKSYIKMGTFLIMSSMVYMLISPQHFWL